MSHETPQSVTSSHAYTCVEVQISNAMYPFRRAVDGAASNGDVIKLICHLFGTTVTCHSCTVPSAASSARYAVDHRPTADTRRFCRVPYKNKKHFAPNLQSPVRSLFSRVQARRDRPTPCLLGTLGDDS